MAERDRFELDLAAALRAYLEEAPTEVRPTELARQFAEAYPHGRPVFGVRGLLAVPRVAWVLLLLAGLLLALVGGMLVVGSQLWQEFLAVVPGYVCPPGSTPDEPGPIDQARPTGWGPMAFDRAAGRIVRLADAGTWTFDVCSNTWTLMQSESGPHSGTVLVYDPGADLIIGVDSPEDPVASPSHVWAFSLADNSWTRKGPAPYPVARLWYDPSTARVAAWVARGSVDLGTIWTYDVAGDSWAVAGTLETLGGHPWDIPATNLLAYDARLERVVATMTGGQRTRLFDMHTGSVVDVRAVAPWAGQCGWLSIMYCNGQVTGADIAYEERTEQTVVRIGDTLFAYDAAADRWDTLYEPSAADSSDAAASPDAAASALVRDTWSMVFDPVNGRLAVQGDSGSVLAFDATTREWRVLLGATEAQTTRTR